MKSRGVIGPLLAVSVCLLLASCGKLAISGKALDDFRGATKLDVPSSIQIGDDEVGVLAGRAGVSEDVVRDVAPALHEQPTWKSGTTRLREMIDRVPDEVRSGAIEVVCDILEGDITSPDEMVQALVDKFGSVTEDEATQIVNSVSDYYYDMSAAMEAGDEAAATVVLACFIAANSSD